MIRRLAVLCLIFLNTVQPATLAENYARQTESLVFNCYTCHSSDVNNPVNIPQVSDLSATEIIEKLTDFRKDMGEPTIMNRIAKGYSEEEIRQIADYLAENHD